MKISVTPQDFEALESFFERASAINESRYKKFKKRNLSFKVEESAEIKIQVPAEDDIYAIASLLRPFTLKKQEIYIYKIWKALMRIEKQTEEKKFENAIQECKENYSNSRENSFIKMKINGKAYSPQELLDLYLYGRYAKNDLDKRKTIKTMGDFSEVFKFQFIDALDSLIQTILKTANLYGLMKKEYEFQAVDGERIL